MHGLTRQAQRRIDLACGYALGAYISSTFVWVAILLLPGLALFGVIMAVVAGLVGTLRVLTMPRRFWIIPGCTLLYLVIALVLEQTSPGTAELQTAGVGMLYSAALIAPLIHLFRNDFAKSIPPWLCRSCGYPLLGLTEPLCPECGEAFDPEQVPQVDNTKKSPTNGRDIN